MPIARHSAVPAALDSDLYSVTCDGCGSPLQLHVHRCSYCVPPMRRPLGSPSTLRSRLAAAVDRQQAARTPWTEVADAFYASEAFKKIQGGKK
ncbi:hypothetical protein VARIO8X_90047 [Burkholderiales bacterium 8X]|nr:hypothetical protein VARIO8X_90047 [Burkholderiales bacterium 8X]